MFYTKALAFLASYSVLIAAAQVQSILTENRLPWAASPHNASSLQTYSLSSIASGDYTALSHPRFPNHQVRVKKTQFCDPTVKYVGVCWSPLILRVQ